MNRRVLVVIACIAALLLGVVVVSRRAPGVAPAKPRVEAAPEGKKAPGTRSAAEVLLERTPEQPMPNTPKSRAPKGTSPAASAATSPTSPTTGTLRIEADVPGAQVFIDREFIGTAPVTAAGLKPGSHRLNVAAEGYDGIVDTIDVTTGERDVKVKFHEVRLDVAIDVIHKHRLGSCKGTLSATPQGLRYETTEKDDVFAAALTDLEVFQVDYLEKNLKVKLRTGKRYDFADPQGNADRLFVFQRDVDKARERLKKGDTPAAR